MFLPINTYLPTNTDWARQAAVAILGAGHPEIEVLATRLILAREPDHEIPTHSDQKTIRELEPIGLGTPEWCNQGMRTRQVKTYHVLMRDCVRWAHAHGFPVVPEYAPFIDRQMEDEEQQDPEEAKTPATRATPTGKLLTTSQMADAFHGIDGKAMERWKGNLTRAKWAKGAKTDGGGKPHPDLWNPVVLALLLLEKTKSPKPLVQAINKAFQTRPNLAEWRNEWADYAEQYAD